MSENSQQFVGRTVAEAAIKACEAFGLTRSELKYEIVSDVGEKLERRVVIAASSDQARAAKERSPEQDTASSGSAAEQTEAAPGRGSRERDSRRDRPERAGRGDRDRRGGGRGRRERPRDEPASDEGIDAFIKVESIPNQSRPERPEVSGTPSLRAQKAREVAQELARLMGLQLSVRLVQDDADEIQIDFVGRDEDRVIGKRGDVLLALQFLLNRMVAREVEGEQMVVLDAAGYRSRRSDALAELARRLATSAKDQGKAVRLTPMSAHDRRVFHVTLRDFAGVNTRSEGEGIYRSLLIIPGDA